MRRDPSALLSAWGYRLEHHRDRLTAYWHGDERYRLTRTPEGIWQWVDRYGNPGGDLLELMRELDPEIGYAEAAHRLLSPSPTPREPRPVLPPETTQERALGRGHLLARGLDLQTLLEAERQGWLRYGAGGLLFLGYDEAGRVRNALWRAIDPAAKQRERDLAGSDLRYAPRLAGVEDTIWIVDEGEDALAVHTLARRRFEPPPTVIVTGGATLSGWLEGLLERLRRAARLILAPRRLGDERIRQLGERTGRPVTLWSPPQGHPLIECLTLDGRDGHSHPRSPRNAGDLER